MPKRLTPRTFVALGLLAALVGGPAPLAAQGTLRALETDVDHIAAGARPSVVTVFAQRALAHPRDAAAGAERRLQTRVGSGVAMEPDVVLTTASVTLDAERVMVRTANGIQVEGHLAGFDLVYNLAIVKVEGVRLPPIRFADHMAQAGDWAMVLGTSYRGQPTQSVGNVATVYPDPRQPLIGLTNAVYPGNSGAAALDVHGDLIGLVEGGLGATESSRSGIDADRRPGGMSFVLPAQVLRIPYEALRRDGRIAHGYMGVSTHSASVASDAEPRARVPIGALVERVEPNGPAMKAGLRRGDLIVGFDHDRVEYADHLARWVASTPPGTVVQLVWVRQDIRHEASIVLGESPDEAPRWAAAPGGEGTASSSTRIAELERQIQQLNQQLKHLRTDSSASSR